MLLTNCQSSTCRMALGAGIPCLDYDFYRFRFACFSQAKGLLRVESQRDYREALDRWLTRGKLEEMAERASTEADYFAIGDGENHRRIIREIDKLTGKEVAVT